MPEAAWDEEARQPEPPKPKSQVPPEARSQPASPPQERPLRAAARAVAQLV